MEAASAGLSAQDLVAPPAEGEWSPNEILWHIRATGEVHEKHIRRIVSEDTPAWRHVSPRAQMKKSRYDQIPYADSYAAFAQQRAELLALLQALGPDAWKRSALVKVDHKPGEPLRLTLHAFAWGMANHEGGHCFEFERAASTIRQRGS